MSTPLVLRDLLDSRVANDVRPMHRYLFFLDLKSYADMEAAREELDELGPPQIDSEGATKSERLGGPRGRLQRKVAELEARVRATTVTGVFQILTPERWDALMEQWETDKITDPRERARALIVACFVRFETTDGEDIPEASLNRDDLARLVQVLSSPELYGLSNKLTSMSRELLDLPKSATPSGAAPASVKNSTPA